MSARPIAILVGDEVTQAADGKILVRGGGVAALRFDALPARSRRLGALLALEGPRGAQVEIDLLIHLYDPIGADLLGLAGRATVHRHVPPAGELPLSWIAIALPEIPFSSPGLHRLVIEIDGASAAAPLLVEGPQGGLEASDTPN